MSPTHKSGSVSLVALSCVAVLGIALASFLAVSNSSMKLSNRAYAQDVSRHLAEMGLEQVMRAFNTNGFGSWTHPDATTATKTITIAGDRYLDHFSSTAAKVRVDRYNATVWSAATAFAAGDMVWHRGVWFHCKSGNTNQAPPNATYWTSAPAAWNADAKYNATGTDIVLSGGSAYRCILAHANQVPPNATYWTAHGAATWSASTGYSVNDIALLGGTAYRCISAHTNQAPPNLTYWISVPVIYSEGVATLADSGSAPIRTQLRATVAPAPLFPNAVGAATLVSIPSSATIDSYNSAAGAYNVAGNIGSSAVIAGGTNAATAVTVTSARVNGYVAAPSATTTPYAPLWAYGGTAILTSVASPTVPSPRVDLTRVSRSPFIPQFDVQSVSGGGNLPNGTTYLPDSTVATYTLGVPGTPGTASSPAIYNITRTYTQAGTYYSGLYLVDSTDILTIDGPVILNVTGPLHTDNGRIIITANGSLEIYFTGQLWIGSGLTTPASGIQNLTLDPKKCILVGTSTANSAGSHYYWSREPFYGTIYMPSAYLSTWTSVNTYGAYSANNIAFPQSGNLLHYDTSLRTAGAIGTFIDAPYLISEWRELTDSSERVTLP
jgi:hypothetical protein